MKDRIAKSVVFVFLLFMIPEHALAASGTITFGRGMGWGIEDNSAVAKDASDLAWTRDKDGQLMLVPHNGTQLRLLSTRKYDQISETHLCRLSYSEQGLSRKALSVGSVLAIRSSNGHFLKCRIVRFGLERKPDSSTRQVVKEQLEGDSPIKLEWTRYLSKSGSLILMSTWTWDLDAAVLGPNEGADVWLEQIGANTSQLRAQNSAKLAIIDSDYHDVSLQRISETTIDRDNIPKSDLKPGKVIAVRTSKGRFAKIAVVGYRARHDFSFEEASLLPAPWREALEGQADLKDYHLELKWTVFPIHEQRN